MSSDESKTRDAINRVAHRIHQSEKKAGRVISFDTAKGKAREIAVNYKRKQRGDQ
jgi:hypothetical protein